MPRNYDASEHLLELRKDIDDLCRQLSIVESYWNQCFPCQNNGRCCNKADTYFAEIEWKRAKKLVQSDRKIEQKIRQNVKQNSLCYFYSPAADRCMIHQERPLHCRYVPFFISHQKIGRRCFRKNHDCTEFSQNATMSVTGTEQHQCLVNVKFRDHAEYKYLDMMRSLKFREFLINNQTQLMTRLMNTNPIGEKNE